MRTVKKWMILIVALSMSAQAYAIKPGDNYVGFTAGLGTFYGGLPLTLNFEHGLQDNIGIGGFVGYWGYETAGPGYSYKYTIIPVGVTGLYHFDLDVDKLDLAVGLGLGFWITKYKFESQYSWLTATDAQSSHIGFNLFTQARYELAPNLHGVARIGYGLGYFQVGIDYQL